MAWLDFQERDLFFGRLLYLTFILTNSLVLPLVFVLVHVHLLVLVLQQHTTCILVHPTVLTVYILNKAQPLDTERTSI